MKKLLTVLMALSLSLAIVVYPSGSAEAAGFRDVSGFKKEIDYLTELKVINGYPDGTFRPSAKLTRAQAVVMIMRTYDMSEVEIRNPGFYDVGPASFGYKEIAYAAGMGIISGKSKTKFDPTGLITRAEMAKVIGNAYKLEGEYAPGFQDVSSGYWASKSISALAANNITIGFEDGTFRPTQLIDRAQFSAFLARVLKPGFRPSSTHSVVDVALESSIVDMVKHPDKPVLYYIDSKTKSLVMLNLETKAKKTVELIHPAEKLAIKNGKVFVTQLIQARSAYNSIETQRGIINVYNADNLSLLKEMKVDIDPFDIAVNDEETLILSSGSGQGQDTEIQTYNWQTSEQLSSVKVSTQQWIELSPDDNRFYTVKSSHYTGRIETYRILNGKIQKEEMESRFFDTSGLRGYAQMTPDGKFLYNGDGTAYALSTEPSKDLEPAGKLAAPFSVMTFNEAGKEMYLADRSAVISIYENGALDPSSALRAYGQIEQLVYVEETKELYVISKLKLDGPKTESTLLERFSIGK